MVCDICFLMNSTKPLYLGILAQISSGPGFLVAMKVFIHVVEIFVGANFGRNLSFTFVWLILLTLFDLFELSGFLIVSGSSIGNIFGCL
jgi:hypothetical protein